MIVKANTTFLIPENIAMVNWICDKSKIKNKIKIETTKIIEGFIIIFFFGEVKRAEIFIIIEIVHLYDYEPAVSMRKGR